MARINSLTNFLTDVANAIRRKTGGSSPIDAEDFDTEIDAIEVGVMTQSDYDEALLLTEDVIGTVGPETAEEVGPVLNNVLGVQQSTETGGSIDAVEAILDDILGGIN